MSTLFVTDLDGTLLGADARISQESAALLRPMLDEGLQLAVALSLIHILSIYGSVGLSA